MRKGHLLPTAYFEEGRWSLRERRKAATGTETYRTLPWPDGFPESRLARPVAAPGDMADFRIGDDIHRGVVREAYIHGGYAPSHLSWPEAIRQRFLHNDRVTYIIYSEGELHRVWAQRIVKAFSRSSAPQPEPKNKSKRKRGALWQSLFG